MTTEIPQQEGPVFRTVIAGDDGREGGRAAVRLARALAPGAALVLARAYPFDGMPSRTSLAEYADALRHETEHDLARTREETEAGTARLVALPDTSPARALHRLAAREPADLVVVGSSHRGRIGRTLLGDVGRDLLHGAPCPVAVAPREGPPPDLTTIGVAYDGSPEAVAALRLATAIAREHGAQLVLRYVVEATLVPSVAGFAFDVHELFDELRREAQATVDRSVAGLGVPVDAQAVVGIAGDELGRLAAAVGLLICGSRGWGTVRRVILGSTADRLIHQAPCPVLVVPRPAAAGGDDEGAASSEAGAAAA